MNKENLEEKIKKARILIVEDDIMLVKFLKEAFQRKGFLEIETAIYAKEALEKIKAKKPDLILLDIIMPKMDGFEFLKIIKENEQTKDILIMVITNLTHGEDKRKAFRFGVNDYIIKSECDSEEILERAVNCLKKRNKHNLP